MGGRHAARAPSRAVLVAPALLAASAALVLGACGGGQPPPSAPLVRPDEAPTPAAPDGFEELRQPGWRAVLPSGSAKKQGATPGWTGRKGHVTYAIDEDHATTDVPENALASAAAAYFDGCNGKVVRAYRDDVPGRATLVVDGTCGSSQALAQFNLKAGRLVELAAVVQGLMDPKDQDDMRAFFRGFSFERDAAGARPEP